MARPPKRRKLRRAMCLPLHAIPERTHRPSTVPPSAIANRVLSRDSAVLLVLDTLLTLETRT